MEYDGGSHLHVVVHNVQEAVVLVVVQGGSEGRAPQEHGAGVGELEMLDWRRRGKLDVDRDGRQLAPFPISYVPYISSAHRYFH